MENSNDSQKLSNVILLIAPTYVVLWPFFETSDLRTIYQQETFLLRDSC